MGIFEDKKYDEMDWLSQAIEPIICSLNDELMNMPNEIHLTYEDIDRLLSNHWSEQISETDVILKTLRGKTSKHIDSEIIASYKVSSNCVVNFEDKTLVGNFTVGKIKDHFEEKELLAMMGKKGLVYFRNLDNRQVTIDRANEILELLGLDKARSSKSINTKIDAITAEYENIMAENKWNVRNVDLSNRIAEWICEFLKAGNLAALTNFCKFKVMTHNGAPIYSIVEEEL